MLIHELLVQNLKKIETTIQFYDILIPKMKSMNNFRFDRVTSKTLQYTMYGPDSNTALSSVSYICMASLKTDFKRSTMIWMTLLTFILL